MNYRQFKIDQKVSNILSGEEKKVLGVLQEAVKLLAVVYQYQQESGLYPAGVTKEEIEKAGKVNSGLLSPFTAVEKQDGKLISVPYHKKYASLLQPVADKINHAAELSDNRTFKSYLKLRAKSLLDGSYKKADAAWLQVKGSNLDFAAGPFERYQDKILFLKRSYLAFVGIIDPERTAVAQQIKDVLYSSAKMSFDKAHSTDIPKKGVSVWVERTPATSGYLADAVFSGEHFPSDLDVMKQYGSKIIIYDDQLRLKFDQLHYPIFKAIFEKKFASKYSREMLIKATEWNILLYELGRQLHKFIGSRERLKELYGPIDEANGSVAGIQHAKNLVVKGLISQDELEAIIIIHIVWMLSDWLSYRRNRSLENYVIGDAITINSYLSNGALREKQGISWPNFPRIFFELEALTDTLTTLLARGSYREVKGFVEKNADLSTLEKLAKSFKNIKTTI